MKKVFLIFALLFLPLNVKSATNGTLGSTSTGIINISLTLNTVVQITSVKDVNLSYATGIDTGDLIYTVDLCIYTNNPSGNYRITESSQNALGTTHRALNTTSGSSTIPYQVSWYNNSGARGSPVYVASSGVVSPTLSGAHTTSNTCNNGSENTAAIQFRFLEADLIATPGGNYNDVVTVTVSPI